jgi:hypothetical protein
MLWTEIRKWAKSHGYETIKDKGNEEDGIKYYWSKLDNPSSSGISYSVSKLARDIYNDITNGAWIDHQTSYKESIDERKIN